MTKFDWRTEEEDWQEEPAAPVGATEIRRRSWLLLALVLVALGVAAAVAYRQVDLRVAAATLDVKEEVLAAHNLVLRLSRQPDAELFRTLISGRDPRWTETQATLLVDSLLFDRPFLELHLAPVQTSLRLADDGEVETGDMAAVSLSPGLEAAELSFTLPYRVHQGGGEVETVALQHTVVYRRGSHQWLLAPAERDFWGNWQTMEAGRLTVVYPQRDEVVVRRLAADLNALLDDVCELDGLACPTDLRLDVRFDNTPASLLNAASLEAVLSSGRRLELPTPTLVGLPVDDVAYQVLARGYGAQLVSTVITDLVGYECCMRGVFYRALLDRQLSQLDLRPWPPARIEYEQLLRTPFSFRLGSYWFRTALQPAADEMWHQALYSLVDFLLERAAPGASVAEMQRRLSRNQGYDEWLAHFVHQDYRTQFVSQWLQFVSEHTASAPPPLAWPEQEVQLVCHNMQEISLNFYDVASRQWLREHALAFADNGYGFILPLPDRDGYFLQEQLFSPNSIQVELRLTLHRQDQAVIISSTGIDFRPGPGYSYARQADPTGRYLVLSTFSSDPAKNQVRLLDVERCQPEACELQPVLNWPLWSPSGSYTLMVAPTISAAAADQARPSQNLFHLYLGNAVGQSPREIGTGFRPFWLDDETYGYIRQDETGRTEMVTGSVHADTVQVRLRDVDLLSAFPSGDVGTRPQELYLFRVESHPANPHILSIQASTRRDGGTSSYFFVVDLTTSEPFRSEALRYRTRHQAVASFSPDGRWLMVNEYPRTGDITHLFDLYTGEEQRIQARVRPSHWSNDGQWIIQSFDHYLLLLAPEHDYQQLIVHDFTSCRDIYWVRRLEE